MAVELEIAGDGNDGDSNANESSNSSRSVNGCGRWQMAVEAVISMRCV